MQEEEDYQVCEPEGGHVPGQLHVGTCTCACEQEAVTNENTYECMSTCVECPRGVSKRACPWGSCELPEMLAM